MKQRWGDYAHTLEEWKKREEIITGRFVKTALIVTCMCGIGQMVVLYIKFALR